MKYAILFMLLSGCGLAMSQTHSINCIVFIDGKLPDMTNLQGNFEFNNGTGQIAKYEFKYDIGELSIDSIFYSKIASLEPEDEIKINLRYTNIKGRTFIYEGQLKAKWLGFRYLILRVTNLKKNKYYFGVSTPESSSAFIKKEYQMFEF